MRPFTLKDAGTTTGDASRTDNYNGQLIRGIADWNSTLSSSTLKPIWKSPEFGTWTTHQGYLDMITYNFQWDPSSIMPMLNSDSIGSPAYIVLYIVKMKDPMKATSAVAGTGEVTGADNLDVTTVEHVLDDSGAIDVTRLQEDIHWSRGVGDSNVILSDKYFDVVTKWNLSYNMKSIQSLNLPGNAMCSWEYKLPGGHRKLHRTQDYFSQGTGFDQLNSIGVSNLEVANSNMTGTSTGTNNLSWLRYEPKMCDWKDQYHLLGFTTVNAGTSTGVLRCRMDYTFSTK